MVAFDQIAIRTRVEALLQDDAPFITSDERDEAIAQAVSQVSHDRPLLLVKDITGDTTKSYDIESLGFGKEFSDVKTVEFPAGEDIPIFLDRVDDWFVYEDPSKPTGQQQRLRFIGSSPAVTETIRVTFSGKHAVTLTTSTLNDTTFNAVVYKTLVFIFRALAAKFGQTTDPSIAADAVDYGGRSQNFLFTAERWENQYKQMIGFDDEELTAAQAFDEVDVIIPHGEDYLMHPSRQR